MITNKKVLRSFLGIFLSFLFFLIFSQSVYAAPPTFFAGNIFDSDNDGTVDRINVVFTSGFTSADLDAGNVASDWTYIGGSIGGSLGAATAQGTTIISFTIVGANAGVTGGTMPTISYDNDDGDDSIANVDGAMGDVGPITLNDGAEPVAMTFDPLSAAGDVAVDTDLTIAFSEVVTVESGDISIYKSFDDELIEAIDVTSGLVTGAGTDTITINPTDDLIENTAYYIDIDGTAFRDSSLNNAPEIDGATTWTFSTEGDPHVLTPVQTIPDTIYENSATYTFTVEGPGDYVYLSEMCGGTSEAAINDDNDIKEFRLTNLTVGETYECDFVVQSIAGSPQLTVGPFTVARRSSSGSVQYSCKDTNANNYQRFGRHKQSLCEYNKVAVAPTTSLKSHTCPADQIITQNLRAPSRNGVYNSYTGGIVTEINILQEHLNRLGFNAGPVDGIAGPLTDGAIKRMQTFLKTTPDGYVGPITRAAINGSCY